MTLKIFAKLMNDARCTMNLVTCVAAAGRGMRDDDDRRLVVGRNRQLFFHLLHNSLHSLASSLSALREVIRERELSDDGSH